MDGFAEIAKEIAGQGPYALVLFFLAWCFVKFWMIPAGVENAKKIEAEKNAYLDQTSALKTIAAAVDKIASEHREHKEDDRRLVASIAVIGNALAANDLPGAKAGLQALQLMFDS